MQPKHNSAELYSVVTHKKRAAQHKRQFSGSQPSEKLFDLAALSNFFHAAGGGPTEADRRQCKLIRKGVTINKVETGYEIIRIMRGPTDRMT